MKSGFESLRSVFRAVAQDGIASRGEIAKALGLSNVSVSKSVRELTEAGLLSSSGSVSTGGRRSEFLCPAYDRKYLAINLCEKPFSYTVAYLGEQLTSRGFLPSVRYLPYLDDLDFGENVIMLARKISSELSDAPTAAAIALPGKFDSKSGSFSGSEFSDYLGDDITAIFGRFGINADLTAGRSAALLASHELRTAEKPCIYLSVSHRVYGIFCGDFIAERDWSNVRVDGLTVSEMLKCATEGDAFVHRMTKFISFCSDVFGAKSVLLDTNLISEDTAYELCDRVDNLHDVTDTVPILGGLLSLLADREIKKLPSSHFDAKK